MAESGFGRRPADEAAAAHDLSPVPSVATSILAPGDTCWRVERAERCALIVDAEDYFRIAKAAMLRARRSIFLIGWDFDTRIELEPGNKTLDGPNKLGRFLTWLSKENDGVEIFVLKWDLGFLQNMPRGTTPLFILDWITSRRLHFRLDGKHPPGAAHHQKIVVVDDSLAFCGGIDMTVGRWDTRAHEDKDPRRHTPFGRPCQPWHDATLAFDGAAAAALGELARERWGYATGNWIGELEHESDPWPEELKPHWRDVDLGIARTWPERDGKMAVYEIEALTLSAIASARNLLYIESQYLASRKVAEALAKRLEEPDGPEIVFILPCHADGWLEIKTMDAARTRLLRFIRSHDRHKRFCALYPVNAAGTPIYVHAKVLIVDDRLLRVGSSNMNNRSMGFDTECDVALEALPGSPREAEISQTIRAMRDELVAEHLECTPQEVREAHEGTPSLAQAIRQLSSGHRNHLELMPNGDEDALDTALAEGELVDPERPGDVRKWMRLVPFWGRG